MGQQGRAAAVPAAQNPGRVLFGVPRCAGARPGVRLGGKALLPVGGPRSVRGGCGGVRGGIVGHGGAAFGRRTAARPEQPAAAQRHTAQQHHAQAGRRRKRPADPHPHRRPAVNRGVGGQDQVVVHLPDGFKQFPRRHRTTPSFSK